jgi:hypothetical protein
VSQAGSLDEFADVRRTLRLGCVDHDQLKLRIVALRAAPRQCASVGQHLERLGELFHRAGRLHEGCENGEPHWC